MRITGQLIELRPWQAGDEDAVVRNLNNRRVWRNLTDRIPHPYTPIDARAWIQHCKEPSGNGAHLDIVLRGEPVGVVGFDRLTNPENRFTAEIGYWLGEAHWGNGFATEALGLLTDFIFSHYDLVRLQATVFEWNPGSCRVLEKNRYKCEARLRRNIFKDDQLIDSWIYARLR